MTVTSDVIVFPCACAESVPLAASAVFVPVWCPGCYVDYLLTHPTQIADPIIFNRTLYALDLRDSAEGIGPEVIVRYFDGRPPLRTTRLRVVMHTTDTADTAVIVHG